MKTLRVKFIDGPLDGQVRDIAFPPVKFELYEEYDRFTIASDGVENLAGYYEQDQVIDPDAMLLTLGYVIFVWIPCVGIPGCLKPLDSIKFAANHESLREE